MVSYATEEGTTICSGDSGGPQFFDLDGVWVQGGVHSWADQDCATYSGSTRTDLVGDWILEQIADYHGTDDICEVNGWYDDEVCDERCEQLDPDCLDDTGEGGGEGGGPKGCGCAADSRPVSLLWLAPLVGLLLRRRW